MYWHIDTDVISLIVIAAIYIFYLKVPALDGFVPRTRRFMRCLFVGICVTAIDIAASIIMEVPTTRFLYHLLMTIYFVSIELVIVEWFLYVLTILFEKDEKTSRRISRIVVLSYILYALFNLANPWTGLVYTLGPNNAYQRGPLFSAMLVLYTLYTIALFILILVRWKHIPQGYPSGVLLLTPVIIAAGIASQLLIPGCLFVMPSYMICLVLAFLFLQTMRTRSNLALVENLAKAAETDLLTGLFNRTGMEVMVQRTLREAYGQRVLVLIADIDDLKQINDTMGHAEGDRAIRMVAAQLKRHFRANDTVVRYGGDEFLVFFTGALTPSLMHNSLQQLASELGSLYIGEQNDVPLHGSIGAASGIVGTDSFASLCGKADTALYHVKRNGKNGYAFYQPEMETERLAFDRGAEPPSFDP